MSRTRITLPPALKRWAKRHASKRGLTLSQLVARLLRILNAATKANVSIE